MSRGRVCQTKTLASAKALRHRQNWYTIDKCTEAGVTSGGARKTMRQQIMMVLHYVGGQGKEEIRRNRVL